MKQEARSHRPDIAPGSDADPLLTRFLAAWDRLSDANRLRLVEEAEQPVGFMAPDQSALYTRSVF